MSPASHPDRRATVCAIAFARQHAPPLTSFQPALDLFTLFQLAVINGDGVTAIINAGVTWTLGYEWVFYLSLPVISLGWKLLRLEGWVLFVLAIVALWIAKSETAPPYAQFAYGAFAPFLLGGLVGEVGRSPLVRRFALSWRGSLLTLAAGLVAYMTSQTAYSVSVYILLALAFAPIAYGNSILGLLTMRAVTFLGEISFDIYLFHGIVLFCLFTLAMPDALARASTSGRLFSLIMIGAAGTVVVSTVVHRLVERPMLGWGRRLVLLIALRN